MTTQTSASAELLSIYRKIRRSDLQRVHRLQHGAFALVFQVVKRSFFRHEIGMADDGADEKPVIRHFLAPCRLLKSYQATVSLTKHHLTDEYDYQQILAFFKKNQNKNTKNLMQKKGNRLEPNVKWIG